MEIGATQTAKTPREYFENFVCFYEQAKQNKQLILAYFTGYDHARNVAFIEWCDFILAELSEIDPDTFDYTAFRSEYGGFVFETPEQWRRKQNETHVGR